MDAVRLGAVCRALRIRKHWRQVDLARRAGVSPSTVSRIERGQLRELGVGPTFRVIEALGGRLEFLVRWQGGDLDRLLNARHSALHESVARFFANLPEWEIAPEVSFSIFGERGVIDILAWHAPTRTVLVIELKTEIVDINELMGVADRKRRLAAEVADDRGWHPKRVALWLIVADGSTNRRRVRSHATTLRAAFPSDGRSVRGWLLKPSAPISALSFWSENLSANAKANLATVRRVRRAPAA